jgi:hypothetical protein
MDSIPCGPTNATSLYISGSPGLGKTALLHEVLESLSARYESLRTVVVNCMGMTSLDFSALKEHVVEGLDGALPARSLVDSRFNALLAQGNMRWYAYSIGIYSRLIWYPAV